MLDKELEGMSDDDFSLDELMEKIDGSAEKKAQQNQNKRKNLGRGLEALLGGDIESFDDSALSYEPKNQESADINLLYPSPFQPRKDFDEESLNSLAESIREKGVLQPLLVRKKDNKFEIIAGERRFRASKLAGLKEIPIIVKAFSDKEVAEVALVENLLRENLSPIEEAEGFKKLMEEFSHTQEVLSKVIGKSRSYVANALRLLNLSEEVKVLVRENKLSAGHARNLVGLDNDLKIAKEIISKDMSVRQVEELVAKIKEPKEEKQKPKKTINHDIVDIQNDLMQKLGLKVKISNKDENSGKVVLEYSTIAELDKIVSMLDK